MFSTTFLIHVQFLLDRFDLSIDRVQRHRDRSHSWQAVERVTSLSPPLLSILHDRLVKTNQDGCAQPTPFSFHSTIFISLHSSSLLPLKSKQPLLGFKGIQLMFVILVHRIEFMRFFSCMITQASRFLITRSLLHWWMRKKMTVSQQPRNRPLCFLSADVSLL